MKTLYLALFSCGSMPGKTDDNDVIIFRVHDSLSLHGPLRPHTSILFSLER